MEKTNIAGTENPMAFLSQSRRDLLTALRVTIDGATCDDLAGATGMSASGTRIQLVALASEGLIERRPTRSGPGRPQFTYRLTPAAAALFPSQSASVALELLDLVGDGSHVSVRAAMDERNQRRAEAWKRKLTVRSMATRVEQITERFRAEGFVALMSPSVAGECRLSLRHCPLLTLAEWEPHVCSSELQFLQLLMPESDITCSSTMATGADECCYRIRESTLAN